MCGGTTTHFNYSRDIFEARYRSMRMKRFRLSTLIVLIVIAALNFALVRERWRAARRESILEARLVKANGTLWKREMERLIGVATATKQKK